MAIRATCVALVFASLLSAGCGTVANVVLVHPAKGGKTPFGGVRHDLRYIHNQTEQCQGADRKPLDGADLASLVCAADLPLSFVGDVLTWPYTASYSFINGPVPVPPPLPAPVQTVPQGAAAVQASDGPAETLPTPKELPPSEGKKQP